MTREELIEDIKKSVPEIVKKVGDNFNWNKIADMVEKKTNESTDDEEFEETCVYIAYAAYKGFDI